MHGGRLLGAASAALVVVAMTVVPAAPAVGNTNLIVNGSFESPDIPFGTYGIFASIPGWVHGVPPGATSAGIELQDHVAGAPAAGAGDQFLEIDSDGPSRVSQHVATSPGTTYRLELLWSPRPFTSAAENEVGVVAGPASLTLGPLAGGSSTNWTTASLDFVAVGASTEVALLDLGPEQAVGGFGAYLDQVSLVAVNSPPDCSAVAATPAVLSPPNRSLQPVTLTGATDPDGDDVTITITGVTQDEPVNGSGDGNSAPDAVAGAAGDTVQLRAERAGTGDGRVYRLAYTATDEHGSACTGSVVVTVPHDRHRATVDSGDSYDSFGSGG